MTRFHPIAAALTFGAVVLSAGLLAGCDSSVSAEEGKPPTTLVLLDDDTVVESVVYDEAELDAMTTSDLEDLASALRIDLTGKGRERLIEAILEAQTPALNVRRGGEAVV